MILGVSKYGVKVASLDQCVSRSVLYFHNHHARRLLAGRCWANKSKWKCLSCSREQDVLHRHPLYLIVRMLCYDDGLGAGKNLLALKTTDAQQEECSIWVYQCSSSVGRTSTVSDARGPLVIKNVLFLFRSRLSPSARCCRLPSIVLCPRTSPDARTDGGYPRRQTKPLQTTAPDLSYSQNWLSFPHLLFLPSFWHRMLTERWWGLDGQGWICHANVFWTSATFLNTQREWRKKGGVSWSHWNNRRFHIIFKVNYGSNGTEEDSEMRQYVRFWVFFLSVLTFGSGTLEGTLSELWTTDESPSFVLLTHFWLFF